MYIYVMSFRKASDIFLQEIFDSCEETKKTRFNKSSSGEYSFYKLIDDKLQNPYIFNFKARDKLNWSEKLHTLPQIYIL